VCMNRPYVILSAAMTLGGKIAASSGDAELSDKEDLVAVHRLRSEVDAIMVGIETVLIDDPMLNVRYVEKKKDPIRIIADSRARLPLESRIAKTCHEIRTYIAASQRASQKRIQDLENIGVDVIQCGEDEVDLACLLDELGSRGIRRLMLEGGSTLNWGMARLHLIDEVRVMIAPFIVGGESAKSLVGGEGFSVIQAGLKLKLEDLKRNGDFVSLRYVVI
jgi:2,5-diamino-6-(ribosylamino)-4(3H)-pyrimidinone 5'-phosphate reductase